MIILMGALVATAVYDAVGARLFPLPMTPATVEQATGGNQAEPGRYVLFRA